MAQSGQLLAQSRRAAVTIAALVLSACASAPPELPPPFEEPVPVVVQPDPVEPAPPPLPPQVLPNDPGIIAPPIPQPPIAVVMSSRHPAYEGVAAELSEQIPDYSLFDLSDKSQPPITAFHLIADSGASAVVAIGLRAAISASAMSEVPVVFCQVFNIGEHDLITDNTRGVSALPPLGLQIAAWKEIDPNLRSIGAIVGEGHEALIEEAELAAIEHGIELHIRTAKSDRETLYLFNRLVGEIDGFWLFPDNRVLSPPVLKEMLDYAIRHQVQVSVFNELLLPMGATMSATPVDSDIAETVLQVLRQIADEGIDAVQAVSPLSDIRIVTNDALLQKILQSGRTASKATLVNNQ